MKIVWKKIWARKYAPFMCGVFIQTFQSRKGFNISKNKLFVPEGNLYAIYFAGQELKKLISNYTNFLIKFGIKKYAIFYEGKFREFLAWAKNFSQQNFQKLNNKQLDFALSELTEKMLESSEYQFMAFLVTEGLAKEVEEKLMEVEKGWDILSAITTPYKTTLIAKAHLVLLKMVRDKKIDQRSLKNYVEKYAWLSIYEYSDKPWSMGDVLRSLKSIRNAAKELNDLNFGRVKAKKEYLNYLRKIKNRRFRKIVEIVHYFGYLKEMRDDYRRQAYYHLIPFWQEIAKRLNLTLEESNFLISEELIAIFRGKNSDYRSLVKRRMKKFAITLRNGKIKVYSGGKASAKIAKLVEIINPEQKIEGTGASGGLVKGRVKIINHREEFGKFKAGGILVTTMTHPEFLGIMRQAKAIITDEGGITCHAAIVARELGIPCVINTKIATRVLKDGDLVEVDADRGIVKKLK